MSHASKSKAKGISASSFFDLKAEVSKKEEEFSKNKASGKSTYTVGGVSRPDKKVSTWARQNKGVKARASRDVELEEVSRPTLESARAALERKAKIYDKLSKGKTGGLNDKQFGELLVDFESKPISATYESDSDDVDESLTVPRGPEDESDPIVEYEDEFGRVRTARRSEVPRDLLPSNTEPDEDEDIIIRNPINHFPVYEPSAERVAEIEREFAEENNPLNVHYDAAREVRTKGAAFYQLSGDAEQRKAQLDELRAAREETEKVRKEMGAVDIRPGEVEGMRNGDEEKEGVASSSKSRILEERKRKLEERRKAVDAKRKKPKLASGTDSVAVSAAKAPQSGDRQPTISSGPTDPFAVLEATPKPSNTKGKANAPALSAADAFLVQLERDLLAKKS
ncbi:hypothetical protein BDN72DRAFT_835522 [Pluteus cervinus]|uniref:Uncharacterized protein n=1 Tax=Pluteus cervinus TaxID=181527 RepID=A0ACD3B5L3_9AGAR|nr:hypothetical protein BDN72DRAFT_835522 [Pluteus cervinus]